MGTPNILLTRIDNRLVHGQVGVTWTTSLGANLIVVADDGVAQDKLQQQLMSLTAESSGAGIRFFTLQRTIDIISKAAPSQKIFLVCKTPEEARKLIEGGVPITEVNVGNMHFTQGKHPLSKKVYVDDKDLEDLKFIKSKGINLYIQDVPGDLKEYID
ncbi:MAG: agaB [Clostridiales bacterium]|jgi:PTS system galactosamine-specific IIB component|nr:agaB [Clostridiales bacterium]